jgi:hypothetical protein
VQCAEPVTGSSGTPCAGAKKRETKSMPFSPRAVTIAAQQSTLARRIHGYELATPSVTPAEHSA